ncbi:MAG: helix-turn-helix domain-containing protein [Anaerotignaceae bacterium]
MLCKKKYKVLEVAGMLGYSNPSKFAKAFSTVMGTTPSEFLKNR